MWYFDLIHCTYCVLLVGLFSQRYVVLIDNTFKVCGSSFEYGVPCVWVNVNMDCGSYRVVIRR